MKHKVSELAGARLDAAVAKAEIRHYKAPSEYCPSSQWHWGGPIIERERICVMNLAGQWRASIPDEMGYADKVFRADTPLIAAMRAYVASKFGNEVELP